MAPRPLPIPPNRGAVYPNPPPDYRPDSPKIEHITKMWFEETRENKIEIEAGRLQELYQAPAIQPLLIEVVARNYVLAVLRKLIVQVDGMLDLSHNQRTIESFNDCLNLALDVEVVNTKELHFERTQHIQQLSLDQRFGIEKNDLRARHTKAQGDDVSNATLRACREALTAAIDFNTGELNRVNGELKENEAQFVNGALVNDGQVGRLEDNRHTKVVDIYASIYSDCQQNEIALLQDSISKEKDVRAFLNGLSPQKYAPVEYAIYHRNYDVFRLLINKGARVFYDRKSINPVPFQPLHWIAFLGDHNLYNIYHQGPVYQGSAQTRDDRRIIRHYREDQASAINNKAGQLNCTPLHVALINGHHAIAMMLIAAGAEVTARMVNGDIPLTLCIRYCPNHYNAFIGNTANRHNSTHFNSALMEALKSNNVAIVQSLCSLGADHNPKHVESEAPLMLAVEFCHQAVAHFASLGLSQEHADQALKAVISKINSAEENRRHQQIPNLLVLMRVLAEKSTITKRSFTSLYSMTTNQDARDVLAAKIFYPLCQKIIGESIDPYVPKVKNMEPGRDARTNGAVIALDCFDSLRRNWVEQEMSRMQNPNDISDDDNCPTEYTEVDPTQFNTPRRQPREPGEPIVNRNLEAVQNQERKDETSEGSEEFESDDTTSEAHARRALRKRSISDSSISYIEQEVSDGEVSDGEVSDGEVSDGEVSGGEGAMEVGSPKKKTGSFLIRFGFKKTGSTSRSSVTSKRASGEQTPPNPHGSFSKK